ncbi:UvrD-like helicase C-terminal domain [Rhizoctonia solani]|uniref:UvrD-like helicase C-terminal domain n=1 Tax=Rhizoctonia solani TaxID=456999 RepID=A0A8H7LN85_9AGAM|nr:UvrD-like helicase C-terminal domain [Rhizoctonia solani]
MTRPSRLKSGLHSKSPEISREHLPSDSPTSPIARRPPNYEVDFVGDPRPSNPEEWIIFAQKKLWTTGKVVDVIQALADIEPDLLEFLMSDEEVRGAVRTSVCGAAFPSTRTMWLNSLSYSLFQRFLTYINRLPPNLSLVDRAVDEACRQVMPYLTLLSALGQIQFAVAIEHEEAFPTKKSQKRRKASNAMRVRQNTSAVDPRLFTAVGLEHPTTIEELQKIEVQVMQRLQVLLEVLLGAFESAELGAYSETLFFGNPFQQINEQSMVAIVADESTEGSDPLPVANPGVFPHIRPLAAAKYFDEGSALGAWSIIISGRAVNDLRQMRKGDSHVFGMVEKKITELSQGFFSESNQKRLVGLDTEVPIYEAKVSRDIRIVYQIDLDTDVDAKIDKQSQLNPDDYQLRHQLIHPSPLVIRIYGVYTHAQLDNRLWALVSHYHIGRRGKEYRRRCLHRETPRAPGQNVTLPAYFPYEDTEVPGDSSPPPPTASVKSEMTDKDLLNLHSLIALEKFIPMSRSLIDAILNDSDSNHVFQVSPKEKEIIYHDSACFVLGRSGTGKTTSIVFKMIGIEKLFEQMGEMAKPRQVFVTQSRVLAQRVQEYYQSLVSGPSDTSNKSSKSDEDEEHVLADLDDEDVSAFGLPAKYSMLEDRHFPLFVTFDQLCSLLEADFGLQFKRLTRTKAHAAAEKRFALSEVADVKIDLDQDDEAAQDNDNKPASPTVETTERMLEAKQAAVTFEVFVAAYWPHFDYQLKKGLDPALVYSEFLGIIEGSEAALSSKYGALSRDEYVNLSHKKSSFASQRGHVYDLYEAYRKRKRQLRGYDSAERTHALVVATSQKVPGFKFDCLYIDEAQDNLLIDMKLLHNLSNNPHGIFVAGDTAQTISAGSSFRFEDLKAFMWRLEEKDDAVRCGKRKAIHPALFHLAVNYRSHGGIVDCASSITQLISELFPYSIDKLKKETGITDGPKPVFFSGWERGVVRFEQFLRGEAETKIDFGASQVILVRNEAARNALREQVGEIGLILTLYESKGLEFDDVLLYNFFEDSVPNESTWRVILQGLHVANIGPVPRFDEIRHAVICTELKNLYVGLTRARNHCWIWDVSEKAEPMKLFWRKQGLIKECGPNDPMPQLSVSSTDADWAKSGRLLFNKRLYPQAIFCFEKANLLVERDIAAAYESRKQARLLQAAKSVDRATRRAAFAKTASEFLGCAILSKGRQQTSCYLRAAECYLQAEDWKAAAEAFYSANDFDMAARNFRRAGCFDEAVHIVKKHRNCVQNSVAEGIVEVAKLEYFRTNKLEKASGLFDEVEEQLEYMEDYGFTGALIQILELRGEYDQAAAVAFAERNVTEGVRLLSQSGNPVSVRKAIERALHGLWMMIPFGVAADKRSNPEISLLIDQISGSATLNDEESREATLRANNVETLLDLAQLGQKATIHSKPQAPSNSILSLLCFSHSSRLLTPHRNSTIHEFIQKAKPALRYITQLLRFARSLDISSLDTQKLLGFEPVESQAIEGELISPEFWIHSTSPMFEGAQNILRGTIPSASGLGLSSLALTESDTRRLALSLIYDKVRSEVRNMHNTANLGPYLYPCLDFAIFGKCTPSRGECGKQEVNSRGLSEQQRQEFYNQRTRALIIQSQIVHAYQVCNYHTELERRDFRRIWARRLYENLLPHFPPLGSIVCLNPQRIPELGDSTGVLSAWCEDALHELDPGFGAQSKFLSDVLAYLDISFRIHRQSYIAKLHSRRLVRWREDLMAENLGPGSEKYSIVHDFINFYDRKSPYAILGTIRATSHIVFKSLTIEANVLINILEFVGREIIVQGRIQQKGNQGELVFDQLLVPQSWAFDMAKRRPLPLQKGILLGAFLNSSLSLTKGITSALYGFNSSRALGLLLRAVLIMRVLQVIDSGETVANNMSVHLSVKEEIRKTVSRALTGPGDIHNTLCAKYVRANSWHELWNAVRYSALNRGADELVHLSLRSNGRNPPNITSVKSIVYGNLPELEQLLSLVEAPKSAATMLNPGAKPFTPQAPNNGSGSIGTDEDIAEPTEVTDDELLNADDLPDTIMTGSDLTSVPQLEHERPLTPQEIVAGRIILSYYRRHTSRQLAKMQKSVAIIWAYYLRHKLRHKSPMNGTEEQIRKLHNEYKGDIELINCPLLYAKAFQYHERILLGLMPHVMIYLRGLERVNQQEKETNKKRLQKVQHEELERVQSRMNACAAFAKKIKVSIRQLAPGSSALHQIDTLRDGVKQVDSLRTEIMRTFGENTMTRALEDQYNLGIHIILSQSYTVTVSKSPKPDLNTSDIVV